MEKYIKLDVLGKGANGSVTLVKNLENNTVNIYIKNNIKLFAMKKIFIDSKNESENNSITNEVIICVKVDKYSSKIKASKYYILL